jgi:hypothetical protein
VVALFKAFLPVLCKTMSAAVVPHFHSKEQLLSAFHAAVSCFNDEYKACKEPTQLAFRVRLPEGTSSLVVTVSVQPPPPKRKRRKTNGEDWGGYHGHLLFKRPETGAVARIKQLLGADANLASAVWTIHGKSRAGATITHKSYLCESLADKAWSALSDQDKLPWHDAAEEAKGHLAAVDWSQLEGALDECKGFARFMASLKALSNKAETQKHTLVDLDE